MTAQELVFTNMRCMFVTRSVNSNLYWAMLGGRDSIFGIITPAVVKVSQGSSGQLHLDTENNRDSLHPRLLESRWIFWNILSINNHPKTYSTRTPV